MASSYTKWWHRLRERNIEMFGGHCNAQGCTSTYRLEFHHQFETEVKGRSRGSYWRQVDVRDHPLSYIMLCRRCHTKEHPDIFRVSIVDQVDDMEEAFLRDHPEVQAN